MTVNQKVKLYVEYIDSSIADKSSRKTIELHIMLLIEFTKNNRFVHANNSNENVNIFFSKKAAYLKEIK